MPGKKDQLIAFYKAKEEALGKMDIQELADELEVSVRTIRRWHACGLGPPRKRSGRKLVYRRSEIQQWRKNTTISDKLFPKG